MSTLTADTVLARLHAMQSDEELRKYQRYFKFGEGLAMGKARRA